MPRLPTMRVMGPHAISTSWPGSRLTCDGSGMIVVIELLSFEYGPVRHRAFRHTGSSPAVRAEGTRGYQVRVAPVSSFLPGWRHFGSLSRVRPVIPRRGRIKDPYSPDAVDEREPPGGSSMHG